MIIIISYYITICWNIFISQVCICIGIIIDKLESILPISLKNIFLRRKCRVITSETSFISFTCYSIWKCISTPTKIWIITKSICTYNSSLSEVSESTRHQKVSWSIRSIIWIPIPIFFIIYRSSRLNHFKKLLRKIKSFFLNSGSLYEFYFTDKNRIERWKTGKNNNRKNKNPNQGLYECKSMCIFIFFHKFHLESGEYYEYDNDLWIYFYFLNTYLSKSPKKLVSFNPVGFSQKYWGQSLNKKSKRSKK